eukprot:6884170-Prymnesium_polylepis.1
MESMDRIAEPVHTPSTRPYRTDEETRLAAPSLGGPACRLQPCTSPARALPPTARSEDSI